MSQNVRIKCVTPVRHCTIQGYELIEVPPKKLSFRFRISLSDMTNYKSADF